MRSYTERLMYINTSLYRNGQLTKQHCTVSILQAQDFVTHTHRTGINGSRDNTDSTT